MKRFLCGLALSLVFIAIGAALTQHWFGEVTLRENNIKLLWCMVGQAVAYGYVAFERKEGK